MLSTKPVHWGDEVKTARKQGITIQKMDMIYILSLSVALVSLHYSGSSCNMCAEKNLLCQHN